MSGHPDTRGSSGALVRLYRSWLHLYSAEFRMAYGPGMEQTFVERLQEARQTQHRFAVAVLFLRESMGVLATAVLQRFFGRFREMRGRASKAGSAPPASSGPSGPRAGFGARAAQDFRHALLSLRKSPGYATVAILTLALGIGSNTAIFSVVNGVLLKPLPYERPDLLIRIWEADPQGGGSGFSPPNFESYRSEATLLEDMVAYGPTSLTLTGGDEAERITAMQVSAGFFEFLGTPLSFGREFLPEEDGFVADPGAEQVVILGYGTWQRRFGGDRGVVGENVVLDGISRTVVGIAPNDLSMGFDGTDVWIPWPFDERDLTLRGRHWLGAMGRLRAGVTLAAAVEELETIAVHLGEAYPETNSGWGAMAVPLRTEIVGDVSTPLWVLLWAVGLVLLVACANVGNLSLARAEARSRELAVRSALGAGRGRLINLLLFESVLLALVGGATGLLLAHVSVPLLLNLGSGVPRASEVGIDVSVLAFTAVVALVAGVLVGLISVWQGFRRDILGGLKEGGQHAIVGRGRRRVRSVLVVAEVALSLMLVIGAGLLIKSFWLLTRVDIGFDHRDLLTATISMPESSYQSDAERAVFFAELLRSVEGQRGVQAVAATTGLPFVGGYITTISIPERPDEQLRPIARRRVTAEYFRTMGIPLLQGRTFQASDEPDAPHVVVINEALARRIYPDGQALGRHILWGSRQGTETLEIVGIVGDVKQQGLADEAMPAVYLEYAQFNVAESMYLTLRATSDPFDLVPIVRQALRALDPSIPLYEITTMEQLLSDSVGSERFSMLLLGTFAAAALLLGAVGIYGVLSYTVSQRTREVGLRMALGAAHTNVVTMILRQGMGLVLIGILLGTAGAIGLSRVLAGMLYGITATDPTTFAAVVVLLTCVAMLACYAPAKRAAGVDPLEALRYE